MVTLRPSRPGDAAAIRNVLLFAFPTPEEADLVDALRADEDILLEWVAEANGGVVAAVQYSPLVLRRPHGTSGRGAALAPVAVLPSYQGKGIGGQLIEASLTALRAMDLETVIVLGHPDYYPRFGFSAEVAGAGLIDPFDAGPAFMALPLAAKAPKAQPIYARAFGLPA